MLSEFFFLIYMTTSTLRLLKGDGEYSLEFNADLHLDEFQSLPHPGNCPKNVWILIYACLSQSFVIFNLEY